MYSFSTPPFIYIHPSTQIYKFSFKEFFPIFGAQFDYIIQIDGVNFDSEDCFDWFKGRETGDIFIFMSLKKALEENALL